MWFRKIKHLIILICIIFASNSYGQNTLLWKFYGGELKDTSYLFGTAHVNDEEVFRFDSLVYHKINSCETLTGELNMDSINMMEVVTGLFMKNGQKLPDLVSDKEYNEISQKLKEKLGPLATFADYIKPLFLITIIQTDPSVQKNKSKKGTFLDDHLQKYAQKKGLEIKGLETMADQIGAIDKLSYEKQAEMLVDYMKDVDSKGAEDSLQAVLISSYLEQDLEAMMQMINEDGTTYSEEFIEAFINTRNKNMTEKIVEISKKETAFHTFGAGHLAGEKGIIQLLRDRGYFVEPVYFSFN